MKFIDCKKLHDVEIAHWGDIHWFQIATSEKTIKDAIKWVEKTDNRYMTLTGDMFEAKSITNPHFDADVHTSNGRERIRGGRADNFKIRIGDSVNGLAELFQPIAERILLIAPGNHEEKLMNTIDLPTMLAEKIGVPTERVGTWANILKFEKFNCYEWHGNGNMPKLGAGEERQAESYRQIWVKRKLKDLPGAPSCKLQVMHHVHRMVICPPEETMGLYVGERDLKSIYRKPGEIKYGKHSYIPPTDRWFASSGSALKGSIMGVSTYTEKAGYRPTELGFIKSTIENGDLVSVEKVVL